MALLLVLLALLVALARAQIPCDDAYGAHCPEEIGWPVGDCLKKQSGLPQACTDFIAVSDACKADIDKHCLGKEYTGDLLPCLTEWIKPAELSPECLAVLPKKEVKQEKKKLTKEEQAKADKRRRTRNKAAKYAREL